MNHELIAKYYVNEGLSKARDIVAKTVVLPNDDLKEVLILLDIWQSGINKAMERAIAKRNSKAKPLALVG